MKSQSSEMRIEAWCAQVNPFGFLILFRSCPDYQSLSAAGDPW